MRLGDGEALIQYHRVGVGLQYYEYATAVPHTRSSHKRSSDGRRLTEEVHCRWLFDDTHRLSSKEYESSRGVGYKGCMCSRCGDNCPCRYSFGICHADCHPIDECRMCQRHGLTTYQRGTEIVELGEECYYLNTEDIEVLFADDYLRKERSRSHTLSWQLPPPLFRTELSKAASENSVLEASECPSTNDELASCNCFEPSGHNSRMGGKAVFRLIHGEIAEGSFALYARIRPPTSKFVDVDEKEVEVLVKKAQKIHRPIHEVVSVFNSGKVNQGLLIKYMDIISQPEASSTGANDSSILDSAFRKLFQQYALPKGFPKAFSAIHCASQVYENLNGATISLRVLDAPLHTSFWYVSLQRIKIRRNLDIALTSFGRQLLCEMESHKPDRRSIRAHILACIAMFESGHIDVDPVDLVDVIALASGNSIFVAPELLSDPAGFEPFQGDIQLGIKRVVGNIGRAGMSFLVMPATHPLIRPLSHNIHLVPYMEYDFKREDNYGGTSLHLSFTQWKRPLGQDKRGTRDESAFLVEAFVSVHDRGKWVADMDVNVIQASTFNQWECRCQSGDDKAEGTLTSLDHWDEVLDPPDNTGIMRAHGNWAARLAASAIRHEQGKGPQTLEIPKGVNPCFTCLPRTFKAVQGIELEVVID